MYNTFSAYLLICYLTVMFVISMYVDVQIITTVTGFVIALFALEGGVRMPTDPSIVKTQGLL